MGQAFTYWRPAPEVSPDEGFRREAETSINSMCYFGCIRVNNIVFVSTWWNFSQDSDSLPRAVQKRQNRSFRLCTLVGRRKHVLNGVHSGATWRIQLNRPCAAAMRPVVKLLWPFVYFNMTFVLETAGHCRTSEETAGRTAPLANHNFREVIQKAYSAILLQFSSESF